MPFRYLIAPRLFAAAIALPIMVLIANSIGIMGGFLLAVEKLGFNPASYLIRRRGNSCRPATSGCRWSKAAVFGFIIALMGCYNGIPRRRAAPRASARRRPTRWSPPSS